MQHKLHLSLLVNLTLLPKETVGRVRAVLMLVLSNDDKEDEDKEDDDKEDDDKEDEKLV